MVDLSTFINFDDYDHLLDPADDDFEWLELDEVPQEVHNPLESLIPIGGETDLNVIVETVKFFMEEDYLPFACRHLLNVELMPFQSVIIDTLWKRKLPLLIACRGAGKSWILAVYAFLRMLFHPGCKVVVTGAAFRQSRQIFDYMVTIFEKSAILRDIIGTGKNANGGPKREVDRCEFRVGDSVAIFIPLGDGTKVRGLRANYIIADEYASIPEEVFNVVIQGFGSVSHDPLGKVKRAATIRKLRREGIWTDEMEEEHQVESMGNQIILSGTAYYEFNHFYRTYKKWKQIIESRGDPEIIKDLLGEDETINKGFNWKDYAIIRVPYTHLPEDHLDAGIIAQAKANTHTARFNMEYGAVFALDTDGFYRRSVLEAATCVRPILLENGNRVQFRTMIKGNPTYFYVMGVDPAAHQDNAAIVILEVHEDHRRIVYCWTTNKKKFEKLLKNKLIDSSDDYYKFIARKIRNLMSEFKIERIVMDQNGGGTAIAEALRDRSILFPGEPPLYEIIDPEKEKWTDNQEGLHILELVKPTTELNSEANHGMLRDFQQKYLLFPMYDTIEMEKQLIVERQNGIEFDTYEDVVLEIEELKSELTTIVCTPTSKLGHEHFDTPEIKIDSPAGTSKKGRLRKDRYSALLYANYYVRSRDKVPAQIKYVPVGASNKSPRKMDADNSAAYYGPGLAKFAQHGQSLYQAKVGFVKKRRV